MKAQRKFSFRTRRLHNAVAAAPLFHAERLEDRVCLAAPLVTAVSPSVGALGVGVSAHVTATFNEAMNRSTITGSTFDLRDAGGTVVPARISYNASGNTATLDVTSPLGYSTVYTARVRGGTSGVIDAQGEAFAADLTWTFKTGAPPQQGPGGPILVITNSASPSSTYYAEILRAEGLNAFSTADLSGVNATVLGQYDEVVLTPNALTQTQVDMFTTWVTGGGNLVAMRPDKKLAGLLGLTDAATTLSEGYMKVNTLSGPGVGIVDQSMQFHGTADQYTLNGATAVATLYSGANTSTAFPAVTVRSVGSNGGQAAAFTYDLAVSVIQTRQGNPAWAGQERDGNSVIRSDDLFFPSFVDFNRIEVPQADEQQRLLSNVMLSINTDRTPLPRFWYFPDGKEAMIVMTGDDHGSNGTIGRFNQYLADGTSGGQPIRGASYVVGGTPLTDAQAAQFAAQGFELALHPVVGSSAVPTNYSSMAELSSIFANQLGSFLAQYPSLQTPNTSRTHAIVWSDWDSQPQVEFNNRIRMDTNYYYWPDTWVQDRPGMFTGSGVPMRFTKLDGSTIDVYQTPTVMTDENNASYPFTVDRLLDNATGARGYYGAFTVNAHTDNAVSAVSSAVIASAKAHNVPVITPEQLLNWTDGRNGSSFSNMSWAGNTLSFAINVAQGAAGLQAMIPLAGRPGTRLSTVTANGSSVGFTVRAIKGVQYAFIPATAANYAALYVADTTAPTVTARTPAPGATGVPADGVVTATFSEPVQVTAAQFTLRDASNNPVAAAITYDDATLTATLTPSAQLALGATYTATVAGVTDTAGNVLAAPSTWSFTVSTTAPAISLWQGNAIPAVSATTDPDPIEVGVKFTSTTAGYINGVRFFKGAGNTGTHTGSLWSSAGAQLATGTFTNETGTGWQTLTFTTPVAISANTTYVASYYAPNGHYAADSNYFATSGFTNGNLQALSNNAGGGNGVFRYATGGAFPNTSFQSTNYWVDPVFSTGAVVDNTPPTVTAQTPAPGATGVAVGTTATATFSEDVQPATIVFTLTPAGGAAITATQVYDAATRRVTLTPSAPLATSTTYTASVSGAKDTAGNVIAAPATWTFTTVAPDTTPPTVTARTPAAGATGVAVGTTATATFSEDVQPATIVFTLTPAGGAAITATQSYNATTRVVTLTPSAALAGSTTYTASVSGVKDTAGNVIAAPATWTFTTAAVDTTPPTVTGQTPAPGSTSVSTTNTVVTATFGEPMQAATVTTSFVLKNPSGATVPATVTYAAGTRTATLTPSAALAAFTTYTATVSGAKDTAGNAMAAPVTWTFTTGAQAISASLWGDSVIPTTASVNDPDPVEIGMKFTSVVAGYVTGVRFYKGAGNTGVHTGNLWSSTGTRLATGTFTNETATGWQTLTFATPVAIAANTRYVVSYFAPSGHYAGDANYFASTYTNGNLQAPSNASAGGNGVYHYAATGGFPNASFQATNYWVDVTFAENLGPDSTPPTVTDISPESDSTAVLVGTSVSATFSEPIQPSTATFVLKDAANNVVATTQAYDTTTLTATWTPTAPLASATTYTATLSGVKDSAGNTLAAPVSWSFTTGTQAVSSSLWTTATVPTTPASTDTAAVEVGVKFTSTAAGYVTGVRFYKGTGNSGTHTGSLWSSTGTRLATGTFTNETAAGWQTLTFASPVAITPNTTYVVSYFAPNGRYANDGNYFASARTNGTLQAPSSASAGGNGVYRYGTAGGFPNASFQATNYWVDVTFAATIGPDSTPPTVTGQSPAAGSTGVTVGSQITMTFSETVQPSTATFVLKDASNNVIATTAAYDPTTQTITWTPTSPLSLATTYTATVSGVKDSAGNALAAPVTWSFTTAAQNTVSLWSNATVPATPSVNDVDAVEIGMKFTSTTAGYITGVRFYKGAGNSGTHTANLWSSTGTRLATATFTTETPTGWQQVTFSAPVAINANTTYVVSYFAPNGHYAGDANFFATAATNANLQAPSSASAGGNGVYRYGATSAFPNSTFQATNYWVDVVFAATVPDTTAPVITARTPAPNATGVLRSVAPTVTFSEAVLASSITFLLRDPSGTAIAATFAYDPATRTATLTPSAALVASTTYTLSVSGATDAAGNTMAGPVTWTFTTGTT